MKKWSALLILVVFGCSTEPSFNYQPVKFGLGEGYEEVELQDGRVQLRVLSFYGHSAETLHQYFYRRVEESCGGPEYQVFELNEMIDVCADAKCFKSAVQGLYKCT
ncbi:hypothetical protein [Alteromonas ponticola]|uniref:Lipoprotein n=1 Tax=Alteromonas ponticola TaxID=2720613 RepID=A0ABX1R1I5_9ALTE|nr:hypothetical protein [Alteromonas ponticola]NMH60320.1 hypothetical protein [Alteromonas ponticola]